MARKLTFKEQIDGFPWVQLAVLSMVRFSEPIAFTSLFPYVFFMVKDFHIAPNDAQVSKYSGYLSSSFALCQVISSLHWGKFSDKHGRKPALYVGLLGTCASLMILGFSTNFYQALLARSLMGLLNGNVSVLRTMIGEIATERKHQAMAFSTMPLLFQFGTVVGPMIGGYLSFPRENTGEDGQTKMPKWFTPGIKKMVHKYPYSLPNIVVCFLLIVGLTNAILFLEETHPIHKYRRDYGVELGDFIKKNIFRITPKQRYWNINSSDQFNGTNNEEFTPEDGASVECGSQESAADSVNSVQSIGRVLTRRQSVTLIREYSLHEPTDNGNVDSLADDGCVEGTFTHQVLHTNVFFPISVNFIMALHLIVYNEFLPVFLAYDLAAHKDTDGKTVLDSKFPWKISGGIGYQPEQTGTLLSTTGMFGCFVVIFIFPVIDRTFDCLSIFRMFVKIYPIMYLMVPYVIFLQQDSIPKWCTIVYLYFITGSKTLVGALTSPQIMLLIHNSSPLKYRAMINGATLSVSASARFTGPLIWGIIMSWSQQHNVAWLSWWSLGFISMVALYQSYKIEPIDTEDETPPLTRRSSLSYIGNRQANS